MIITGKVKFIELSVKKDWLTVVVKKTRNKKPLEIAVFFSMHKFGSSVSDGLLCVGMSIDITCFVYSRKTGYFWSSYLVAENWRKYKRGQARFKEVASHTTGEIFKVKGKF